MSSREFYQKTNEWIRFYYYGTCFRSFIGRNWSHQKGISKLTDLYDTKHKFFHIWFFASYMKLTKTDESMKRYFQAILWISLDQIIVQAPIIPHFKGLVMRNLEYVIRICQKIHNKVTITMSMLSSFFLIRRYMKRITLIFFWLHLLSWHAVVILRHCLNWNPPLRGTLPPL